MTGRSDYLLAMFPDPDVELLPCGCQVWPDGDTWETEYLCDWHLVHPWTVDAWATQAATGRRESAGRARAD